MELEVVETASIKVLLREIFVRAVRQAKADLGDKWKGTRDRDRFEATMNAFGKIMDDNMQGVVDEFMEGVTVRAGAGNAEDLAKGMIQDRDAKGILATDEEEKH